MERRHVIVLTHATPEHPGLIEPALRERGLELRTVRTHEGDAVPGELEDAAGLVIMGGPMGVYEHAAYPHLRRELALLERALRAELPVLGVCLGSQLLAAALGAQVTPGPAKEIGWHDVYLTDEAAADPLFAGAPATFAGFHWHGDVFSLPAGATSLAASARTKVQAFRHGAAAYGLLFHLEVTAAMIEAMVAAFADELRVAKLDGAAILKDMGPRVARLNALGQDVFSRWGHLLP